MSKDKVCIATLDPSSGGVSSMARFVYEVAEDAGYDPYLAYNSLNLQNDVRVWNIYNGMSVEVTRTTVDGMEARYVPRVLPEFEFWQYRFNHDAWREMISDADICFGVGGNNHCCHPFVLADRSFGCWIATPLWEDRVDRLSEESIPWRIRDHLSRPLLERLEKRIFEESKITFALSDYTATKVAERYNISYQSIEVLPFPIDTDLFNPGTDKRKNGCSKPNMSDKSGGDDLLIQFVGRYTDPRKNIRILLEAFVEVNRSFPKSRLQLIGSKPTPELKQLSKDLNIDGDIEFIDRLPNDELPDYYRQADVFVIPSNQEGLGIVGLEAMACGTPVISTRCGGPEQYIEDDKTGVLVPVNDPDSLTKELKYLLSDPDTRERLGANAHKKVQEKYAQSVLAPKFVDALKRL